MKKVLIALLLIVLNFSVNAQTGVTNKAVPHVDIMRSNGKIFVVMAVILIIMIGFFSYLLSVDRKITKLEIESK